MLKNTLEEIIADKRNINVSFEFFPPKSDEMEEKLWVSVNKLKNLNPEFVSVTYGAGGTTQKRTFGTIKRIIDETDLKPAVHLTCIGASKSEVNDVIDKYYDIGVRKIVALRGDMPASSAKYQLHPDGYKYANELVEGIKKRHSNMDISVAGYPDKHPEANSLDEDIDNLKRKVDAGADRVITQFFFDSDTFLRFVDKCRKRNITVPIIPGILPVSNVKQMIHFSKMCGTKIPKWMIDVFGGLDERVETRKIMAGVVAIELCRILHREGISDFHFYTLNRSDLVTAICHILGVRDPIVG